MDIILHSLKGLNESLVEFIKGVSANQKGRYTYFKIALELDNDNVYTYVSNGVRTNYTIFSLNYLSKKYNDYIVFDKKVVFK